MPPSAVSPTSVTVFDNGTPGLFTGEMTAGNEEGTVKFTELEKIELEFLFNAHFKISFIAIFNQIIVQIYLQYWSFLSIPLKLLL